MACSLKIIEEYLMFMQMVVHQGLECCVQHFIQQRLEFAQDEDL